jgi:hypothetical protein
LRLFALNWIVCILARILFLGTLVFSLLSVSAEKSRYQQFKEHQKQGEVFDQEREKALTAYLEEMEQWELLRLRAKKSHKRQDQRHDDLRDVRAYRLYQENRVQDLEQKQKNLTKYLGEKTLAKPPLASSHQELEELGLLVDRPRYEIRNRVLYGAKPGDKKKKLLESSSQAGSRRNSKDAGSSFSGGSDRETPDFGNGDPSGSGQDEPDFMDFPPPPPPPPMPSFDDSDLSQPPPPFPAPDDDDDGF